MSLTLLNLVHILPSAVFHPCSLRFQTALVICIDKPGVLSNGIVLEHYSLVSLSPVFKI